MRRVQGTYCGWHDQNDCLGSYGRVYLTKYIHEMEFHLTEACEKGVLEIMFVNTQALVEEHNVHNVEDRLSD